VQAHFCLLVQQWAGIGQRRIFLDGHCSANERIGASLRTVHLRDGEPRVAGERRSRREGSPCTIREQIAARRVVFVRRLTASVGYPIRVGERDASTQSLLSRLWHGQWY
jgi:hypothetical protein